jgi:hypothetical protein
VFATAVVTVIWLVVAATLVFGVDVWWAFYGSLHLTQTEVLEAGGTGWHKIQSVFAWMRMWGADVSFAYTVQGAATLAIAGTLVLLWRSEAPYPLKAAALVTGAILATPYSLDYDMMVLAPAIAYLAVDGLARGFSPWEKTALALLWIAPFIARATGEYALLPLGTWAMILVFALTVRRAASDVGILSRRLPA